MAKKQPKRRDDLNQLAARIVAEATGQAPKTPDPDAGKSRVAVSRGRKGGKIGGAKRAAILSPAEKARIARLAAAARWAKAPDEAAESGHTAE